MFTSTFHTTRLNDNLNALQEALLGAGQMGDAATVIQDQARLLVRDAIKFTPPVGRTVADQKRQGEAAIRKDLLGGRKLSFNQRSRGIFFAIQQYMPAEESENTVRLFTTKRGISWGVEKELFKPNASFAELAAHHKKYRSKRTGRVSTAGSYDRTIGRWKFIDRMAVNEAVLASYLLKKMANVGYMKAGWKLAAQVTGLKLSTPFIRRHNNIFGVGISDLNNRTVPSVIIGNRTKGIGTIRHSFTSAVRKRADAMRRRIKLILSGYSKDLANNMRPRKSATLTNASA